MAATRVNIGTLVVTDAYEKQFSTGSRGWFGKAIDPSTNLKYQITAVQIGSKNGKK